MNITLTAVLADPHVTELAQAIQEAEDKLRSNPDDLEAKQERDRLAAPLFVTNIRGVLELKSSRYLSR